MARLVQVFKLERAHDDSTVVQALMLAIEREMITELVEQHPSEEAHVGAGAFEHLRRCRGGQDRPGRPCA